MLYEDKIDKNRIPAHIAIIMDGNGRWARSRGMERSEGHAAGVRTVWKITEEAIRMGVRYLTLYTFSTENWKRPDKEVKVLMDLILKNVEEEVFMKNNVRLRIIGDMQRLPVIVRKRIEKCLERTAGNTRADLVIALSYSSRWEITKAVHDIADDVKKGLVDPDSIDENLVSSRLETNFMPDPDLIIRTGGEMRLSNYLMWQASYSELYFTDVFWPDFEKEELCKAIWSYQQRERRYGLTSAQIEEIQNSTTDKENKI